MSFAKEGKAHPSQREWEDVETRRLYSLARGLSDAADGVFAIDQGQRLVLWNKAAERLLGFQASEVLGRPCYEVLAGRDRAGGVPMRSPLYAPLDGEARKGS